MKAHVNRIIREAVESSEATEEQRKPFWLCQECGHKSLTKAMPPDRERFYARIAQTQTSPTCPSCKSQAFMPTGF